MLTCLLLTVRPDISSKRQDGQIGVVDYKISDGHNGFGQPPLLKQRIIVSTILMQCALLSPTARTNSPLFSGSQIGLITSTMSVRLWSSSLPLALVSVSVFRLVYSPSRQCQFDDNQPASRNLVCRKILSLFKRIRAESRRSPNLRNPRNPIRKM